MNLENLEKLPELVFKYSAETELEQLNGVQNGTLTPRKRKFYLEKGYDVMLPEGISLKDEKQWTDEELLEIIKKEIDEEKADKMKEEITRVWPYVVDTLKKFFAEIGYEMPDNYWIRLTKYGPGGQFYPPNGIIIAFTKNRTWAIESTLIHEGIHDAIHDLIRKYGFDSGNPDGHWVKEHMVDRLMAKVVPNSYIQEKKQLGSEKIEKIDEIFDQNYPNVEKILEEINKQIYDKQN